MAFAAKILLLLALASAGKAFTYPSWRGTEGDLKKTNLLALRLVTLPSVMMLAFYLIGWQAAVVLGYAQTSAIGLLRSAPAKTRLKLITIAARTVIAVTLFWCVFSGDNSPLRNVLWMAMAAAFPVAFEDLWANAKLEKLKYVLNHWPWLVFRSSR